MRTHRMYPKPAETQETMLARRPVEVGRDGDARESVVFDKDLRALPDAVFEDCAEPWVCPAWYV